MPATITSAANPLLKDVRRAIARNGITAGGLCVAEGLHLLEEAIGSGCEVAHVLAAESAEAEAQRVARRRVTVLPESLFRTIATTETSQGVVSLVRPPEWTIDDLFRGSPLVVVLDGVQDPGNAGAIVRAAEAFEATGVLFVKGSASPLNPKALRASTGSAFRVPWVAGVDAEAVRMACERHRVIRLAAVPSAGRRPADTRYSDPCALIIGSEGRGVSAELRDGATEVSIPTARVESLNAAMAAGILLYEIRRQRSES